MDNIQDQGTTAAPTQGQAQPPAQMPSGDAQSGSVGTAAARADGQSSAGQEGLILGKFKSNEDLAKAYTDLESHNKTVEMGKAELEKLLVGQPETQTTTAPQAQAAVQDENPLTPVIDALRPELSGLIGKITSPVLARFEIEDMSRKYGQDFLTNGKAAIERKQKNPSLSLEEAYQIESFKRLQTTNQENQQQQQTVAAAAAVKAQVETSRPSGYRPASIEDAAVDPNVPVSEVAEALGPEFASFAETSRRRATKNPK